MRKEQIITTNNNQMEEKGMKSRFIHFKKRFVPALSGALMGVMLMSTTCFAAGTGTSAVTQPLENLKTLIIAVIGAVGVIMTVFSLDSIDVRMKASQPAYHLQPFDLCRLDCPVHVRLIPQEIE